EASRLVIVGDVTGFGTVMASGDFNADGNLDFVSGRGTNQVIITFGNGDFSFQPSIKIDTPTTSQAAVAGDFNGDGIEDVAIAGQSTTQGTEALSVVFGSISGALQASPITTALQPGYAPLNLAAGDFDGDGILDVAVGYGFTSFVSVLRGHGDGSFDA